MSNYCWKRFIGMMAAGLIFYAIFKTFSEPDAFELYFGTFLFFLMPLVIIGQFFLIKGLIKMENWAWIIYILISVLAIFLGFLEIYALEVKWSMNILFNSFFEASLIVMPVLGISFIIRKIMRKNL